MSTWSQPSSTGGMPPTPPDASSSGRSHASTGNASGADTRPRSSRRSSSAGRVTQTELVRRVLLREGYIATKDAIYSMTDSETGEVRRITRLAAIIWKLRHEEHWDIETVDKPGYLAVYRLRRPVRAPQEPAGRPESLDPDGADPEPAEPEGDPPRPIWRCTVCGAQTVNRPDAELIGGYAKGPCTAETTAHRMGGHTLWQKTS